MKQIFTSALFLGRQVEYSYDLYIFKNKKKILKSKKSKNMLLHVGEKGWSRKLGLKRVLNFLICSFYTGTFCYILNMYEKNMFVFHVFTHDHKSVLNCLIMRDFKGQECKLFLSK